MSLETIREAGPTCFNARRDFRATFEAAFDAVEEEALVEVGGLTLEHHGQLFRRARYD